MEQPHNTRVQARICTLGQGIRDRGLLLHNLFHVQGIICASDALCSSSDFKYFIVSCFKTSATAKRSTAFQEKSKKWMQKVERLELHNVNAYSCSNCVSYCRDSSSGGYFIAHYFEHIWWIFGLLRGKYVNFVYEFFYHFELSD